LLKSKPFKDFYPMKNILLIIFSLFWIQVFPQTYLISDGGTVNTCAGTFYDSGGAGGNYTVGSTHSITFCPANPGTFISLQMVTFDVDATNSGGLCFYDGPTTSGISHGCITNLDGLGMPITLTSSDASGCMTITFSAGITAAAGWTAFISCTSPCQQVVSVLDACVPAINNGFIDICPGDDITFNAHGGYPQNATYYNQSDATSTFLWTFGDGTSAQGPSVTHNFSNIGGYDVNLKITDIHGCTSANDIGLRVRVNTEPNFAGTDQSPDTICIGETSVLAGVVNPTSWSNIPTTVIAGTTFLPDGLDSYSTILNFDNFNPGQTLTSADDLLTLCLNMEHSYMGDLTIQLECPNGSYVTLLQYPNSGGGTFFGEPIDSDSNLNPGVGYTYCWSPASTYGNMNSHTGGTMAASPPNYEETGESGHTFESLIGCPLNGDWTITVIDNLNSDNGYIFWWGIDFEPSLYPSSWEFTPVFTNTSTDQYWSSLNNDIVTPNGSTVTVQPPSAGIHTYTFTAIDNAGCSFDTSLSIYVRPQTDAQCCINPIVSAGNNAVSCGLSYQLNASLTTGNTGIWSALSGPGTALFSNPTLQNAVVNVDAFGTYTFRWKETYNPACLDSAEVSITFTKIDFTTSTQDITCNGYNNGRASVNVTSSYPPYTMVWSNGGFGPMITGLDDGNFSVTIYDGNGCDTSASVTINEPLPFTITPSPDLFLCYGEHQFIYANPFGGISPYNFYWNNTLDSASIYIGPLASTSYTVSAEDANGCRSDTFKIMVYVDPPLNLQLMVSHDTVCPGDPVLISTLVWGGSGGPYYIYVNDEYIESPPIFVYPNETTYYIIVARDRCGTYGVRDTVLVNTYPLPQVMFQSDKVEGCQPLPVSFNELNNNTGASFLWNFGDIDEYNTSVNKYPTHVFREPGVYDVSLTLISKEGCSNSRVITDMITVFPTPDVRFVASPIVTKIINPLVYFDNYTTGAINYFWSFGDGDSSQYISPQHVYKSVNTFPVVLTAQNEYGCLDTSMTNIMIMDEYTFFAPSAFSPDKDGINDIFNVYGHGIDPKSFLLSIYDRWGGLIFQTKNMNEGWNGVIKDSKRDIVKGGVFSWQVVYKDISGVEHQHVGSVTLIQ